MPPGAGRALRSELDLDHDALDQVIREFIAAKGQAENARVLIYFAGHGYSLPHRFVGQMGYVVPADAPRPDRDQAGFVRRGLPMDQVEVYAKTIQSKHALFLFDSCFSGSIFDLRRTGTTPAHISAKTAEPVRQFITSGRADETVPDKSVFRRQLVAALDGEGDTNGDGYVTAAELGEFLFEKVVNYSRETQHPQYGKIRDARLDKGDFVFRLPPPPVPPDPPATSFYLDDLERRAAWADYLGKMKAAFAGAEGYEGKATDASLKAKAWQRFADAFADDDPFSEEDQALRSRAAERLAHWRREATNLRTAPPPPSPGPSPRKTPEPGDERTELGMRFHYVPAGTFQMGSPPGEEGRDKDENLHEVTLTRGFWMAETEVTQSQWKKLMGNNPSLNHGCVECPVEEVSWWDAVTFANHLSKAARLEECYELACQGAAGTDGYTCQSVSFRGPDCKGYRLPTEAEWERAARAGTQSATYAQDLGEIAWYSGNSESTSHPVGDKRANAWGLHDMLGNVSEWVEDAAEQEFLAPVVTDTYAEDMKDPLSKRGSKRVLRGGAWAHNDRAASRHAYGPDYRDWHLGFRVLRTSTDLRAETGRLALSISPGKASVYVDGRFIGVAAELAAVRAGLLMDQGDHTLQVFHPGHESVERPFVVEAGKTLELTLELRRP